MRNVRKGGRLRTTRGAEPSAPSGQTSESLGNSSRMGCYVRLLAIDAEASGENTPGCFLLPKGFRADGDWGPGERTEKLWSSRTNPVRNPVNPVNPVKSILRNACVLRSGNAVVRTHSRIIVMAEAA